MPAQGLRFSRIFSECPHRAAVRAIPAPGGGISPPFAIDKLNDWAQGEGAAGLGYILRKKKKRKSWSRRTEVAPCGKGPIAKNLGPQKAVANIAQLWALRPATRCSLSPASQDVAVKFAGPCAHRIGEELGLIAKDRFEFCWIVDFPMYEWNEEEKKIDFSHNPFSMPKCRCR